MKHVIITGAGTGIGAATARKLAQLGWSLTLIGRRRDELEDRGKSRRRRWASAHSSRGPRRPRRGATHRRGDAGSFGRIDALVNNAATIKVMPLEDFPLEVFRPPLGGQYPRAVLAHSDRPSPPGASVGRGRQHLSSSGTMLRPGQSLYGMTKAALEYLTRSLAGEFAGRVRINALALGPVDTPIHETWATNLAEAYLVRRPGAARPHRPSRRCRALDRAPRFIRFRLDDRRLHSVRWRSDPGYLMIGTLIRTLPAFCFLAVFLSIGIAAGAGRHAAPDRRSAASGDPWRCSADHRKPGGHRAFNQQRGI